MNSSKANQPPPQRLAICHCDFQPFNILVDGGRVSGVIDWANTMIADPALDLGFTVAEIATVPIQVPGMMQPLFRAMMKAAGRSYCRSYCRMDPLDEKAVSYYQVFGCASQLTWAYEYGTGAFASAAGIARLVRHIRSLTGIELQLDPIPTSGED